MMVRRATERRVHGGLLETKQFIQGFIADSYRTSRLAADDHPTAAEVMESGGDARTEISAIKVFVPRDGAGVDRAIQVHGALASPATRRSRACSAGARTLRLADGPDEVHRILIAKKSSRSTPTGILDSGKLSRRESRHGYRPESGSPAT